MSQLNVTACLEECGQSSPLISMYILCVPYFNTMKVVDSNRIPTLVDNVVAHAYAPFLLVQVKDVILSWSPVITLTTPIFVIRLFVTSVHLTMCQG